MEQLTTWQIAYFRDTPAKPEFFFNLTLEMSSHHFCHILFIRSESLGHVHTQGVGEYAQEPDTRLWDSRWLLERLFYYIFLSILIIICKPHLKQHLNLLIYLPSLNSWIVSIFSSLWLQQQEILIMRRNRRSHCEDP